MPLRARYFLLECAKSETAQAQEAKAELARLEKSLPAKGRVPGVTLCMIVKNEEDNLEKCLCSAEPYVDEIVIVDTGSTDSTVSIARSFGAHVTGFKWCGDFSAARNVSLDAALCQWILWLDADDIVPPGQEEPLARIKASADQGFYARIMSLAENAERPEYLQLRFLPNRPELRFEQRIHEQVAPSLARAGIPIVESGFRIIHTGYADIEKRKQKAGRNIQMIEQELASRKTVALYCALGDAQYVCALYEPAANSYRAAIQAGGGGQTDRDLFLQAHVGLSLALKKAGRPGQALDTLKSLLRIAPDKADALFLAADLAAENGESERSIELLKRVLDTPELVGKAGVDYVRLKRNALLKLIGLHAEAGEWELCLQLSGDGMERYPNVADFWIWRGEALLSLRQLDEAVVFFDKAIAACPDTAGRAYAGKAGCRMAQGKAEEAQEILEQGRQRVPSEPRIHELLGDVHYAQKKPDLALPFYETAMTCGYSGVNLFWKSASCSADLKDYAQSLRYVEQILAVEPQNGPARELAGQLRGLVEGRGA